MNYRIAAVSFLNTLPLIDGLDSWTDVAAGDTVALSRALPSRLAGLLAADEADVALLPVVEVFRGRSGGFFGGTGIACRGAVDSVKLYARGEPGRLVRVAADRGSRTSVALLKILLAERYGVRPDFVEIEPQAGFAADRGEGLLVIGDRCFEVDKRLREEGRTAAVPSYDLGAMWHDWTGLPFVFAVWAVAPALPERAGPDAVRRLERILGDARDRGLAKLPELAAGLAAEGRLGRGGESGAAAIERYFDTSLRYRLGETELAGIDRFHELCRRHGLVPDGPAVRPIGS